MGNHEKGINRKEKKFIMENHYGIAGAIINHSGSIERVKECADDKKLDLKKLLEKLGIDPKEVENEKGRLDLTKLATIVKDRV